ncbi:MAG: tRNA uridine-5-carboxymethylaminomethyl(34) synthesis GTPase MnmE [Syntrophales bacterium]|jgi:tRNA modification GTPase|nr:tRNA uridine-5-carboxymethylaminomethyl(34) synthesis GTPase MnmE [Syntrophales bacterium]
MDDTIAAIATAPGAGGIAVVRISGPRAEAIAIHLFRMKNGRRPVLETHHLYYGHILSPEGGAIIDEVMIALMRSPRSYTGEDVLEIHGHGGYLLPQRILEEVLKAGARLAEPGEFTKRAFLNNRMDLSQAEAVADMIAAQTDRGLELAQAQYQGRLSGSIEKLHAELTDILALLEAAIDFVEDIDDLPEDKSIPKRLQNIIQDLNRLAASYREGKIFKDGVSVVIAGRTNVGKSSLLNYFLGEQRAIVTPIPGTTRDFIEEPVRIHDIVVRLTDTAGIRKTEETIEQAGIDLVWQRVAAADAVLILLDGSEEMMAEDREIIEKLRGKPLIPVVNKADLPQTLSEEEISRILPGKVAIRISAKYGNGLEDLQEAIYRHFCRNRSDNHPSTDIITHLRHRLAIEKAVFHLCEATAGAVRDVSPELTAADLRDALDALEEIIGKTANDMILARIFASFCIGK